MLACREWISFFGVFKKRIIETNMVVAVAEWIKCPFNAGQSAIDPTGELVFFS